MAVLATMVLAVVIGVVDAVRVDLSIKALWTYEWTLFKRGVAH